MQDMDRRAMLASFAAVATTASAGESAAQADPSVWRAPGFPNLLIVNGIPVTQEFRPALEQVLNDAQYPVRRGSHDAWFVFPWPAQPDLNPTSANFVPGDLGPPDRPFLGATDMRRFPNGVSMREIKDRTWLMIHEGTHAWLAPPDLRIRLPDGRLGYPLTEGALTAAINEERPFEVPPLLGRGRAHWSCFVNQFSTHDGTRWASTPSDGGHVRWMPAPPSEALARVPNMQPLALGPLLGDLDLYLMGLKQAQDCFPQTPGRLTWIDPKLTIGPPVRYMAGLFVAQSPTDFIHFGFRDNHSVLVIERSDGTVLAREEIGSNYRPLRSEIEAMMLRVVLRGGVFHFQACRGNSGLAALAAALTGARPPLMFDNAENPESAYTSGDFSNWQTVARVNASGPPIAVGVMTRSQAPILIEGEYFTFDILKDGQMQSYLPSNHAFLRQGQTMADMNPQRLYRHTPKADVLLRALRFSYVMGSPYTGVWDHGPDVDDAPRLMTRPPEGDFSFGTSCKVRRSLYSPWAGGAVRDTTVWGKEHSLAVSDVIAPEWLQRLQQPAPRSLRNAFIVVMNGGPAPDATALASLDVLRQYYDAALPAMTSGLLLSDSRL